MISHRARAILGMDSPWSCDERYLVKGLGILYEFELYINHDTNKAYILCSNEGDTPVFSGNVSTAYNIWFSIVALHPTLFLEDNWYLYVEPK